MKNKVLNNLVDALKRKYPDARYSESECLDIEDDEIILTENLSLQVVSNNEFGISTSNPFSLKYVNRKDLFKELDKL